MLIKLFYKPYNFCIALLLLVFYSSSAQEVLPYFAQQYTLDFSIDMEHKILQGKVEMMLKDIANQDTIIFQLHPSWSIDSATVNRRPLSKGECSGRYILHESSSRNRAKVTIWYSGPLPIAERAPWDGGFVIDTTQGEYLRLGVACQKEGASLWWPCIEKAKKEPSKVTISCAHPSHLKCISNGKRIEEKQYSHHKNTTFAVKSPINLYSITLNIGNYVYSPVFSRKGKIVAETYVLQENQDLAKYHFQQLDTIVPTMEKILGPYPFPRDKIVFVETSYLGMEHQSCIAYGNQFQPGYLGKHISGVHVDFILLHEFGHEWFGNSITAPDPKDFWIQEGFCTYSEALYVESVYGGEYLFPYLLAQRKRILNRFPIYSEQGYFSTDAYFKASWMLHTIDQTLHRPKQWRKAIKALCRKYRHKLVEREDIVSFLSRKMRRNLTPFFQTYLDQAELPQCSLVAKSKNTCEISHNAPFSIPLLVKGDYVEIVPNTPTVIPISSSSLEEQIRNRFLLDISVKRR